MRLDKDCLCSHHTHQHSGHLGIRTEFIYLFSGIYPVISKNESETTGVSSMAGAVSQSESGAVRDVFEVLVATESLL